MVVEAVAAFADMLVVARFVVVALVAVVGVEMGGVVVDTDVEVAGVVLVAGCQR